MFHNHAYLFLHVGLKVPKGGDFLQRECSPLHRSSRGVSSNFFLRVSPQPISRSLACLVSRLDLSFFKYLMAGVIGFEPMNARVKVLCLNHLTTPQYLFLIFYYIYIITYFFKNVKFFFKARLKELKLIFKINAYTIPPKTLLLRHMGFEPTSNSNKNYLLYVPF